MINSFFNSDHSQLIGISHTPETMTLPSSGQKRPGAAPEEESNLKKARTEIGSKFFPTEVKGTNSPFIAVDHDEPSSQLCMKYKFTHPDTKDVTSFLLSERINSSEKIFLPLQKSILSFLDFLEYLPNIFPNIEELECDFQINMIADQLLLPRTIFRIFIALSQFKNLKSLQFETLFLLPLVNPKISIEEQKSLINAFLNGIDLLKSSPIETLKLEAKTPLEILKKLNSLPRLNTCSILTSCPNNEDLYNLSQSNLPIHDLVVFWDLSPIIPSQYPITNEIGLSYLGRICLKHLAIFSCPFLTNTALLQALSSSEELESLLISNCEQVTDDSIAIVANSSVSILNLDKVNATGSFIENLDWEASSLEQLELPESFDILSYFSSFIDSKILFLDLQQIYLPEGYEAEAISILKTMPNLCEVKFNKNKIANLENLLLAIETITENSVDDIEFCFVE